MGDPAGQSGHGELLGSHLPLLIQWAQPFGLGHAWQRHGGETYRKGRAFAKEFAGR